MRQAFPLRLNGFRGRQGWPPWLAQKLYQLCLREVVDWCAICLQIERGPVAFHLCPRFLILLQLQSGGFEARSGTRRPFLVHHHGLLLA